jgi:hypothetical protein
MLNYTTLVVQVQAYSPYFYRVSYHIPVSLQEEAFLYYMTSTSTPTTLSSLNYNSHHQTMIQTIRLALSLYYYSAFIHHYHHHFSTIWTTINSRVSVLTGILVVPVLVLDTRYSFPHTQPVYVCMYIYVYGM